MTILRLKSTGLYVSLLGLMALSACVNVERSYPDKHYYVLEFSANGQPSAHAVKGILAVADVRVSRRYEGQSFVYRLSETSFESDYYNQFLIAPGALITEEVRKALAQSGLFEHVIGPSTDLQPDYKLQGVVNSLYGDFTGPEPRAVMEMQFFITKQTPAGEEIVLAKRYSKSTEVTARSPDALVKGWDAALDEILIALIDDIQATNLESATAVAKRPGEFGTGTTGEAENRSPDR